MDTYKILAQLTPLDTALTLLYTVPTAAAVSAGSVEAAPKAVSLITHTLVTSLMVTSVNVFGGTNGYDVLLYDNSTATTTNNVDYLIFDGQLTATGYNHWNLALTLPPDATLRIVSNRAGVINPADGHTFCLMGIETTR